MVLHKFLPLIAAAAVTLPAAAQQWKPTKPINLIVPWPPAAPPTR